jgi:hypothetical protein
VSPFLSDTGGNAGRVNTGLNKKGENRYVSTTLIIINITIITNIIIIIINHIIITISITDINMQNSHLHVGSSSRPACQI